MNNREIEERIKCAVEHSAPDVRQALLSQCNEVEGKVIGMNDNTVRKKTGWRKYAAMAAVLILLLGGVSIYRQSSAVDSIIELDVNPSIELSVNKKERVVEAKALNDDAATIMEGMDLKGADLDVAVNALIGSMLKHGYLSELQNSILISVENGDAARGKELEERLVKEIDQLLAASSIDGAILSQQVSADGDAAEGAAKLAQTYQISQGKAALIEKIISQDALLSAEDLKDLNINQLNLLLDSRKLEIQNTASTGKASDKSYIGAARAQEIALKAAGLTESSVTALKVEMDVEHGVMTYEVEFESGNAEYEYEIDAVSGSVLKADRDVDGVYDDDSDDHSDDRDNDHSDRYSGAQSNATGQTVTEKNQTDIGKDKAVSIALKHAGLKESGVSGLKAELDEDDGTWKYEVEFRAGNVEYDYEIDAASGAILKYEKEAED